MDGDPLYQKIIRETVSGDRFTVRSAMDRWGYGESHTRTVMDWMATLEPKPTLRKDAAASPYEWERI